MVAEEAKSEGGIGEGLVRISVGLENIEDLWDDLVLALRCQPTLRTPQAAPQFASVTTPAL